MLCPCSGHLFSCVSQPVDIQCRAQTPPVILTVTAERPSVGSFRRHERQGSLLTTPGNSRAGLGYGEELAVMTRASLGLGFCFHWS